MSKLWTSLRDPKNRVPVLSITAIIVVGGLLAVFLLCHESSSASTHRNTLQQLQSCITATGKDPTIVDRSDALAVCYNIQLSAIRLEEEYLVRDAFVFQRGQSIVLMVMVVMITLSGVLLAALQLLGSYRLAERMPLPKTEGSADLGGRAEPPASETTVEASPGKLVVRSATVGVAILAISFAFFFILVRDVYTMQRVDIDHGAPPQTQTQAEPAAQAPPVYTLKPGPAAPQ